MTSQLSAVALDGRITPLGKPAVHTQPSVSPDGKYLLIRTTHRPYSYQVGMGNFPMTTEVWTPDGQPVRTVNERPLVEAQPSMREATTPGVRSILWRVDEPATLMLVQALDDGDPRKAAAKRDRVSLLAAPFTGEPQPFVDTENRFGGVQWLSPKVALLSDFSAQRTRARTWVIDPSLPNGGHPRARVGDRSLAAQRRHAASALGLQRRRPHRVARQPAVSVRSRERSQPARD